MRGEPLPLRSASHRPEAAARAALPAEPQTYVAGGLIAILRRYAEASAHPSGADADVEIVIQPAPGPRGATAHGPAQVRCARGLLVAARHGSLSGAAALARILVLPGGMVRLALAQEPRLPANLTGIDTSTLDRLASVLAECDVAGALAAADDSAERGSSSTGYAATDAAAPVTSAIANPAVSRVLEERPADLPGPVPQRELGQSPTNIGADEEPTAPDLDLAAAVDAQVAREDTAAAVDTIAIAGFHPPQPGSYFARCLLRRVIGHGATSIVYLAHHTMLRVDVVVKILLAGDASGSSDSDAALLTQHEAQVLARLNHPHILRVFDFGADTASPALPSAQHDRHPHPYLITEYVPGRSLAGVMEVQGRLPLTQVLDVLRQTVKGLAYAHRRLGLVHHDLKPGNLLLGEDGLVRIADFALATLATSHAGDAVPTASVAEASAVERSATASGLRLARSTAAVRGTPHYIAPEAVRAGLGEPVPVPDARSDQYALGATIYHALTGRTLFAEAEPAKLMLKHLHDAWTPPEFLIPGLPVRVAELLNRMLARRAEDRYATWGDLLAELDAIAEGRAAPPRRVSLFRGLVGRMWHGGDGDRVA